jgi:hypothetical protein
MKVSIKVGEVQLHATGLDMDQRQIRQLLKAVASIAVAMAAEAEQEEPERPPLGFSAHIERAAEVAEDYSEYFEE